MRVVKSDYRNAQRLAARNRFPCHLIWVTRLDQVRPFTLQNLLNRPQVYQSAIMRRSRNERRMNEINSRTLASNAFRFGSRDDEHVLVRGRALNVRDLFVHIPLHSPAQRRIELRQIAKLHLLAVALRATLWSLSRHFSSELKYRSASMAAAQPAPAAVT